MDLTDFTIS